MQNIATIFAIQFHNSILPSPVFGYLIVDWIKICYSKKDINAIIREENQ